MDNTHLPAPQSAMTSLLPLPDTTQPPLGRSILRMGLRLLVAGLIALGISMLTQWAMLREAEVSADGPLMLGMMAGLLLAYACLIAVPFVPGVEIGIMLLMLRGAEIAVFVYLATLVGLMLAFAVGRFCSYRWLQQVAVDLRLRRVAAMLGALAPLTPHQRLAALQDRLPGRLTRSLISGRYLVLAVLVNMPGSSVVGGGGGILLLAGLTRLFSLRGTLMTLALAVAPVPLLVWGFDLRL